jgi:pyruvate-formate lyase-activating enzyme
LQEPYLFSRTLRENLAITLEKPEEADLSDAVRAACLQETVDSFSKGYDTFVGERGVTLSGGEPLFFWEWAAELFKAFKAAGLHTCLDTSLYAPPAALEALLPVTDMWLPDYKADDDALHVKYTGGSNKVVRKNLERLVAAKAKMEVRCLVVPDCTDGDDLAARHRYLASLGIPQASIVDLEYYDYARSKYLALGMKDTMPPK